MRSHHDSVMRSGDSQAQPPPCKINRAGEEVTRRVEEKSSGMEGGLGDWWTRENEIMENQKGQKVLGEEAEGVFLLHRH